MNSCVPSGLNVSQGTDSHSTTVQLGRSTPTGYERTVDHSAVASTPPSGLRATEPSAHNPGVGVTVKMSRSLARSNTWKTFPPLGEAAVRVIVASVDPSSLMDTQSTSGQLVIPHRSRDGSVNVRWPVRRSHTPIEPSPPATATALASDAEPAALAPPPRTL